MTAVVVVTGASSGLGYATAALCAARGLRTYGTVRSPADAEQLRTLGVVPLLMDVTRADQVAAAADVVLNDPQVTGVRALVNNAGATACGLLETVDVDELRRMYEINVVAPVIVMQAFMPGLRAASGRVVNVGSIGGRIAVPFSAPYGAAKAATHLLTDTLRLELAVLGMTAVHVEPGAVRSQVFGKNLEQTRQMLSEFPPQQRKQYEAHVESFIRLQMTVEQNARAPEAAAKVMWRAITDKRPRANYAIGNDARAQILLNRLSPGLSGFIAKRLFKL